MDRKNPLKVLIKDRDLPYHEYWQAHYADFRIKCGDDRELVLKGENVSEKQYKRYLEEIE